MMQDEPILGIAPVRAKNVPEAVTAVTTAPASPSSSSRT